MSPGQSDRSGLASAYLRTCRSLLGRPSGGGGGTSFLKQWLRYPLEYDAQLRMQALPEISVPELLAHLGRDRLDIPDQQGSRHAWNLGALEQALLATVVRALPAAAIFEIGTFDGSTTRLLAASQSATDGGQVLTLDLPEAQFDDSQDPDAFDGSMVGSAFRDTKEESRITQLRGDSLRFDFAPWRGRMDLVLVDGAHDEAHGYRDSRTALELARPGGLIFWDDFAPFWHGLVRGVCSATEGHSLRRLRGTSFALVIR